MPNTILQAEHIHKTFSPPLSYRNILKFNFRPKSAVIALDDVSFSVKRGQVVAILGPNGAGKTTLLKIISTLILPDKGCCFVNEKYKVGVDDEKIKALIGLVYAQERSFYWRLTGRQNLEFFAALYGLSQKQAISRLDSLFRLFEVDYADRRFDAYSSGMKQKLALIRALIHDPEILLLDEPTKSLDYTAARNLRDFIKEKLCRGFGKTIVFTTHHMEEATEFCDYFIILHKGEIRAAGSLEELRRQTHRPGATLGDIYLNLCS